MFDEKASERGRQSFAKDAVTAWGEIVLELNLTFVKSLCSKVGGDEVEDQKWEGKLLASRWKDEDLDKRCLKWMNNWRTAPTHMITVIQDLYLHLLPRKLYTGKKIKTINHQDYNIIVFGIVLCTVVMFVMFAIVCISGHNKSLCSKEIRADSSYAL